MLTTLLAAAGLAVQISTPTLITTIDAGKLKGEPTRLSWSPDGTELYLQTSERDAQGMTINHRHYTLAMADGKTKSVDAAPAWGTEYWTWKSSQQAPGSSTFVIDPPKQGQQKLSATSAPMGGDLAKGGGDTGTGGTAAGDVASARAQTQTLTVVSLSVKGESIGEFVGQQFLPGYTFGWSPKAIGMIVYANRSGRLAVMNEQGEKQQVEGTKNVILPAWSLDGSKIVFMQKSGKNKYELYVANVTP
jgi:WD40 repeat protein